MNLAAWTFTHLLECQLAQKSDVHNGDFLRGESGRKVQKLQWCNGAKTAMVGKNCMGFHLRAWPSLNPIIVLQVWAKFPAMISAADFCGLGGGDCCGCGGGDCCGLGGGDFTPVKDSKDSKLRFLSNCNTS